MLFDAGEDEGRYEAPLENEKQDQQRRCDEEGAGRDNAPGRARLGPRGERGEADIGKSQISIDIAARITKIHRWADGDDAPLGFSTRHPVGLPRRGQLGERWAHIRARDVSDFREYIRHGGEEFVFVLGGSLELRFEDGKVFRLEPGDSLYFDSALGHVYLTTSEEDAEVLVRTPYSIRYGAPSPPCAGGE